jgi:hypothetical protein
MLDHIQIDSDLSSLDPFASGYADWISDTKNTSNQLPSKVGLLCSSLFQSIAGEGLGDGFVREFRLLLWTTTIFYMTMRANKLFPDEISRIAVLRNLVSAINACGRKVVHHLDRLCLPGTIYNMRTSDQKKLFLLILGMCLSTTYLAEEIDNYLVSNTLEDD